MSGGPVRYATGQIQYSETDLSSTAFGLPWGHTRAFANVLSSTSMGINGNNWLLLQLKSLVFTDTTSDPNRPVTICVVDSANHSLWFQRDNANPDTWLPLFKGRQILVYDASNEQFVLTDARGRRTVFYDNSASVGKARKLKAVIDKNGRVTTATYDDLTGNLISFVQDVSGPSSGYYYEYLTDTANIGKLLSVTLKVNDQFVRRASYGYYTGDANGNQGDLKTVVIEQYDAGEDAWLPITRKYYRYYVGTGSGGFQYGLKFVLEGQAYQQMVDAELDPETATDAELADFANNYFEYDGVQRVSLERVDGGQKEFIFDFLENSAAPGFSDVNVWNTLTVETLPDGNENRVYCNKAGQVILKIFKDTSNDHLSYEYAEFNAQFRVVLSASSFAVDSVTEPGSSSGTLTVNLKTDEGLIKTQAYYTADDPVTGAVTGYLEKQMVQEGSAGTPVTTAGFEYDSHTAFGQTTHPLRARTVYPTEASGPTEGERTGFSYTWYQNEMSEDTFQMLSRATVPPVVSTGQHGTGLNEPVVQVFDTDGRVTWERNGRGFITNTSYDSATGAPVQLIQDVDTSVMSGVPVGWVTPDGGGKHLITDYESDDQGRILRVLEPWIEVDPATVEAAGSVPLEVRPVSYTFYRDALHSVWSARGYMTMEGESSSWSIIGPVAVTLMNEGGAVTDEIQAVPENASAPLGPDTWPDTFEDDELTPPRESWTRWTHSEVDSWGRVLEQRVYHEIPLSGDGVPGTNYEATSFAYDVMGRQDRMVSPGGTITWTVYEARGLRTATWVGTDDTGATPSDPSGGGATGNNMKKVWLGVYDNDLAGGNGNLTQAVLPVDDYTTDDRVSLFEYDYRDRQVQAQSSDGTLDYFVVNTYDNLDRGIEQARYHTSVATANRTHDSITAYDARGRVFEQRRFYVNTDGTLGDALVAGTWYDPNGNVIKQTQHGALVVGKTVFDSLDRPVTQYQVSEDASTAGTNTNSVVLDVVITQNESSYNDASQAVASMSRTRFDDATGTGPLQGPNGDEPKSRDSYAASYLDPIGRVRFVANFGTNGGA